MADLPDEKLMAYADGALEPAERARIGATLAQSAELRGRLAAFEATGTVLGALFEKPMHEPVPRHLVDLVLNGTGANFQRKSGDTWPIISALAPMAPGKARAFRSAPTAVAFSVALLIGVMAGWYVGYRIARPPTPNDEATIATLVDGRIAASGALARLLEGSPSATVQSVEQGNARVAARMQVRFTLKSGNGYCRQYEVVSTDGATSAGIGCRDAVGLWRLAFHTASTSRASLEGRTKPAGRDGEAALRSVVEALIDGDALGPAEEAEAISKRWQR